MPPSRLFFIAYFILAPIIAGAQAQSWQPDFSDSAYSDSIHPYKLATPVDAHKQVDLIDIYKIIFKKDTLNKRDSTGLRPTRLHVAMLPFLGYTLQTGFGAVLAANAAFLTDRNANENVSEILTSITYTQYNQIIFPLQGNIWTKDNKYDFFADWRYLKYPSYNFGLGDTSAADDGEPISYSYVKFYQTLFRNILKDTYIGVGYDLDYFWNIHAANPTGTEESDFQQYDFKSRSIASGGTLDFLYDSRKNPINPSGGDYAQIIYRYNARVLGSDSDWQSLIVDLRKYIKLPYSSTNVLAIWSYDWITVGGNPPYLLLPSIGWDSYWNTGRGYIQGRFRGRDMAYLEGEYRFRILNNGFLGGVVFANAESFSVEGLNKFQNIWPGWGAGLRIKLNKFSNTNLAVDYGFGLQGSGGVYVNLGEVF